MVVGKKLKLEFSDELTKTLVDCQQCGKCCDGSFFKGVILMEEDIKRIEKHFKKNITEILTPKDLGITIHCGKEFFTIIQPCKFYVNKKCSIYDFRPLSCRQYPLFYFNGEITISDKCSAANDLYTRIEKKYKETLKRNF